MKPNQFILTMLALLTGTTSFADVPEGNITFADPAVKAICVAHWDTNSDGELSYAEAAAVKSLSSYFKTNTEIISFDEFQYFTGVTSMGSDFQNCSNLVSVTIPENVTSIGSYAFGNCYELQYVNIPEAVSTLDNKAFNGTLHTINLFSVHIASHTPKISYNWPSMPVLFVPDDAVDAYKTAWPDFAHKIVPESSFTNVFDVTVTATEGSSAVRDAIGADNAWKVVKLKVRGTINGYDLMAFRNKMVNLMVLDLSEANVIASSYKYYNTYNSKDNIVTGYFAPPQVVNLKLPKDITALEDYALSECTHLKTVDLPEGIPSIPQRAFYNCDNLNSLIIPESVTSIGNNAFSNCDRLVNIYLPKGLVEIGVDAFYLDRKINSIHLPPCLEEIGNRAFNGGSGTTANLNEVYAYMPNIIPIGTSTFSNYQTVELYVPEFLYRLYDVDTNWSQFLHLNKFSLSPGDYITLPTNCDITMGEDDQRIPEISDGHPIDGEINPQGCFTVEGNEPQPFNNVDQILDGEGLGGSLIGEDDGEDEGNLRVNTLRVKINVKAGRWYFFCFPYDVTIANCTYPGQYAWRWYDGAERATNGSGGWKAVAGSTLTAGQGYAFQTSHTGNLIVEFSDPKFGGDRPKTLVAHASANAANASWNLVGNPYSSFYDFLAVDFDSPITVYNSNGTYSAYRPGDDDCHLQPYQAFFVQKPTEVDAINFQSARRESYNQGQAKKAASVKARLRAGITLERRLINLEMFCGDEQADRTRVVLNEQKSRDYELDCDASKFLSNEAKAQLYSIENGVQMAINERPQQGDIRLGYTAAKAGTLSISASRMDMPMVLVDTQLGTTFDLSLGSYDFDTQAGTFNDRFVLRLSGEATAINDITKKTGVCIGTQDGGIAIGGAEGKTVNVFTTGGAQAAQHSGNGFVALSRGVYVVSVDGVTAKVSVK